MPELRLRRVHLPELRLPEMSRDDIVRTIGDARRDIELPEFDLSKIDVPKAIATATQAAAFVRTTSRPRLPFVIGGLVAIGLVEFAILRSPQVRPRVDELGRRARQAIDDRRRGALEAGDEAVDAAEAAVAIPIEPDAFAEATPVETAATIPA